MITRPETLARAASIWPLATVEYNPNKKHPGDGYRQDAAGFLSMCWNIPIVHPGGPTIVSLDTEGHVYEIPPAKLRQGDAIGLCGPIAGSTTGHLILFESWHQNNPATNTMTVWAHEPNVLGPRCLLRSWPGHPWRAYRYAHIVD